MCIDNSRGACLCNVNDLKKLTEQLLIQASKSALAKETEREAKQRSRFQPLITTLENT